MNIEIRKYNSEFSLNSDSRTVTGYGAVFDSESQNIGWIEVIHKGAITEDTIKSSDIFAKFNHDNSKILARSKNGEGSLSLTIDDRGLKYSFEAPKTALGDEVLEYINRRDITASSFSFSVSPEEGSEKWYKKDGKIYRDIYKIAALYDVAPVFQPAYEDTSCNVSARFKEVEKTSLEIDSKMDLVMKEINLL